MDRFEQVKQRIDKFVTDRDWRQFHTPSNLAKSISIEASELLECFQWSDTEYDLEHVKEELADVLNYCIQMSQVLNLDIVDILNAKMDKTEKKYPLEKSKGVSTKYDKL
ncbi:MAG: nucleotide pyrophosphohydrolase [Bacillales bacterium]|nr:nucleotide pyrophosphohydrolase [Bacillales bacterium]